MLHRTRLLLAWLSFTVAAAPKLGRAQDVPEAEAQTMPPPERPHYGYWSTGKARWFLSAKPELGTPYLKPYLTFGYGVPHWLFAGIDANAIITPDFTQTYAGVRAASPIVDFAFGVRDTWSFYKRMLPIAASYERAELTDEMGARARYLALEGELVAIAPLPHSALIADVVMVRLLDVPHDAALYDESYRAIVINSLFFTLRAAAVARLLDEESLRVGVLGEMVVGTGRARPVMRIGPALSLQLTDHLEANAVLTLGVASPDRLGIVLSAYGIAGLRYRWASGERSPSVPWKGRFLPW